MQPRKAIYGKKKEFIASHIEDINALRKNMSAAKVAKVYSRIISKHDIYAYERLYCCD